MMQFVRSTWSTVTFRFSFFFTYWGVHTRNVWLFPFYSLTFVHMVNGDFWTHRVCNSHDWIVRSSFFSKASVTQRHISWQVYSKSVLFLTASISFFFSFCGNWCTSGSVLEGRNTKDTGIKRALARKSGRHLDVVGLCLRSEKYDFLFRQSKNDSAKRKVNHFDLVVRINWNNSHLLLPHFR